MVAAEAAWGMTLQNSTKKAVRATALVASLLVTTCGATQAHAITLMDLIRGGPGKSNSRDDSRERQPLFGNTNRTLPGVGAGAAAGSGAAMIDSDPEPLPTISGPRYYTYKAEAPRAVKTAQFGPRTEVDTDQMTTGSVTSGPNARAQMVDLRVLATDDVAKAVEDYYGAQKPLLWTADGAVSDKAKAAMQVLAAADSVGLDAADYAVALPEGAADDVAARDKALMQFELQLSVKVLTYVQDAARGRIDPNKLSGYHDFKRKGVNLMPVLGMVRLSPDVAAYLSSRSPSSAQFVALRDELKRLRSEDDGAGPAITIASGLILKPGQSNGELRNVVSAIRRSGSETLKAEHAAVLANYTDGADYTPELVSLVEAFQSQSGLKPDGVIGPATVRALVGHSNSAKIAKLVVAMEQLRWLPADLGQRYVFINQPAYQVYYVNEGQEQLSMRVVVGSKSNQTYFFQDTIKTVEVNPYWGVPKSIIVNEMLPKLRRDPSYLDRLGYEVSQGGRKVASSQVDWNRTHAVDVRQPPGGDNALGELKILFPNAHAIYMHDTPSKSFFNKDMRALSHGCVRLAEPRVMAAAVLGTSVDAVGKEIAQGRNKAIPVPGDIPVYIAYFTAWPNKDGVVEYFDDVYDRDSHTAKAFDVTTKTREGQV